MKKIEINRMEKMQGGNPCSAAVGFMTSAGVIMAVSLGAGPVGWLLGGVTLGFAAAIYASSC